MFTEMHEPQLVQLINGTSIMRHIEDAFITAMEYRGSMFWRTVKGREYLLKLTPDGKQTSLGPRTPENTRAVDEFMSKKAFAEDRLKRLREAGEIQRRINKAVRIGRAPAKFVALLQAITRLRLEGPTAHADCLVVGPHALCAYEGRAGLTHPATIDPVEPVRVIASWKGFEKAVRLSLGKKAAEIPFEVLSGHDELLYAPRLKSVAVSRAGHVARMFAIHPIAIDQLPAHLWPPITQEEVEQLREIYPPGSESFDA